MKKTGLILVLASLSALNAFAYSVSVTIKSGKGSVKQSWSGSTVTLTAKPASGYKFSGWSACCRRLGSAEAKSTTLRLTGASGETLYASFSKVKTYKIRGIVKSGKGKVTGSGSYQKGKTAKLTAKPSSGYKFVRWEACCRALSSKVAKSKTLKVKVSGAEDFYAVFAKIKTYKIRGIVKSGKGKVTGSGSYQKGKTAKLTAKPSSGYKFVRWEACCRALSSKVAKSKTLSVKVDGSEDFYAVFKKK